ncbi:MAG: hypothetical protein WCO62_08320 [Betaproteobacteria bacterium]
MITFIKVFDETSSRTRFINLEYITDLELYQYMGEDHIGIHVQSAHGGTGAGGIVITVKGEECKKILYFAEEHTSRHGPAFKHPEGD